VKEVVACFRALIIPTFFMEKLKKNHRNLRIAALQIKN
jgi:hypothetical protein